VALRNSKQLSHHVAWHMPILDLGVFWLHISWQFQY
jgi:hypothetical protein